MRVLRLAAGHAEEASDDAEAGELLEAHDHWRADDTNRLIADYLTKGD